MKDLIHVHRSLSVKCTHTLQPSLQKAYFFAYILKLVRSGFVARAEVQEVSASVLLDLLFVVTVRR